MKKIWNSFYGKLSFIFLLLLIAMGTSQVLITYNSSMQFVRQADQKLNLDLASNMAAEFEPLFTQTFDTELINSSIHDMMVVNPRVEIYILDSAGVILAYFVNPPKEIALTSVDLGPVMSFITSDYNDLMLGEDPKNPDILKPISAAPIDLGDQGNGYIYIILGGEEYDSALSMLQNSYFIQTSIQIFIIILVITGIVGLILFALLTKRLRKLTESMESFNQGDMDQHFEVHSNDEIGRLGSSFNRMVSTIKSNLEELEKTDQIRRELVANVSHDLRSPLASIQGYLETILLKHSDLSEEKRTDYLEIILRNTSMLRQLVEELFELSKLDSGQLAPKKEVFSIADLAQDVSLKIAPQAEAKLITINAEFPDGLPLVTADIAMIERVLSNLIENAVQYSEKGSTILICLNPTPSTVQIAVRDNGPGIPKADIPHIFDRFYRQEKSRNKNSGGTGLGLAIVKRILELHEKQISVESRDGEGTKFSFSLDRS